MILRRRRTRGLIFFTIAVVTVFSGYCSKNVSGSETRPEPEPFYTGEGVDYPLVILTSVVDPDEIDPAWLLPSRMIDFTEEDKRFMQKMFAAANAESIYEKIAVAYILSYGYLKYNREFAHAYGDSSIAPVCAYSAMRDKVFSRILKLSTNQGAICTESCYLMVGFLRAGSIAARVELGTTDAGYLHTRVVVIDGEVEYYFDPSIALNVRPTWWDCFMLSPDTYDEGGYRPLSPPLPIALEEGMAGWEVVKSDSDVSDGFFDVQDRIVELSLPFIQSRTELLAQRYRNLTLE